MAEQHVLAIEREGKRCHVLVRDCADVKGRWGHALVRRGVSAWQLPWMRNSHQKLRGTCNNDDGEYER